MSDTTIIAVNVPTFDTGSNFFDELNQIKQTKMEVPEQSQIL